MPDTPSTVPATFGWSGFATGAAALVLTLVLFWAGPFVPRQAASVRIGEMAAEIAQSAARFAVIAV